MRWWLTFAGVYAVVVGTCVGMAWAVSEQDIGKSLLFGGAGIVASVIWHALEDRIGGHHDDQS